MGKLSKVDQPTDWCLSMTVVETVKHNCDIKTKTCIDPSQAINKVVVMPKYAVPTLQEILPQLSSAKHKSFNIVDTV